MTRERALHWLQVGLYVSAIVIVAKLVVDSALDKGVAWYDKVGLVVLGLAAFAILKRINPDLRGLLTGKVSALADRKTSEIATNLFLTVLGIIATAVGLMAPRTTTESEPGLIEKTAKSIYVTVISIRDSQNRVEAGQQQIHKKLDALAPSSDAAMMQNIEGVWGEDKCQVTYNYAFAGGGLIATSLKNAPGMTDDSEWRGGNLAFKGGILTATTIKNDYGLFEGGAVSFTYKSVAGVETLDRDDKHERVVTRFTRCKET